MATTYENAPYCARNLPVLRCASRDQIDSRTLSEITAPPHPVHLLPCNRPQGTLESAPRTSLREDSSHERWEGFWCVSDEGYYARCVRTDGSDQWYRFADDVALSQVAGARVLPLRRRRMIMFGRGRRSILVGTSRRSRGGAGVSR
jgi:hypothetical protein